MNRDKDIKDKDLKLLELSINHLPISIIITDNNGIIKYVNKNFCSVTGYDSAEVIGKKPQIFNSSKNNDEIYRDICKIVRQGEIWTGQLSSKTKHEELYWENATIAPVFSKENKITNYITTLECVSKSVNHDEEKKLLQEILHHNNTMNAVGQFAANISHDFNNALNGVLNLADLLMQPKMDLDPTSKSYVSLILKASQKACDLSSKISTQGGEVQAVKTDFNVHDLIDYTLGILQNNIEQNLKITVKKNADRIYINGSRANFVNSLLSIYNNACNAMPEGGNISITTSNMILNTDDCISRDLPIEPGNYCLIEVSDTGSGISEDDSKRIFEPFFSTSEDSIGLGLAVLNQNIKELNGTVEVKSQIDKGTTMSILIPCLDHVDHVDHVDSSKKQVKKSKTILFVDDEEINRIVGNATLEELGYKVLLASDGLEAVTLFNDLHSEIDCVILDMIMPNLNGHEAFMKMKKIDINCKGILASGYLNYVKIQDLIESGISAILSKPYQISELEKELDNIFISNLSY